MSLVNETELRAILDGSDSALSVQVFIDQADLLITEDFAGKGLTNARLKMLELYLAAHFYTLTRERGGLTLQRIGESEERYSPVGAALTGFKSTRFGQQALAMDTTGVLQSLDQTNKASFKSFDAAPGCREFSQYLCGD